MAVTVGKELKLKISSRWFWSDSKTVLCWIRSTGLRLKEFVANRIGEIQEDTNSSEWHWLPSKLNVSDQATRLGSKISFSPESEWYKGPEFLWGSDANFPKEKNATCEEEIAVVAVTAEDLGDDPGVSPSGNEGCGLGSGEICIPNPKRFSSYHRLLLATAMTKRVAKTWATRIKTKERLSFQLDSSDIQEAEKLLVKYAQNECYFDELEAIKSGKPVSKKSSIWRLGPIILDDDVLRVEGRIGAAIVSPGTKHPIILPPKHYITELLVDEEHRKCAHQGVETVLANLRNKYWIPEGRNVVQRSFTSCQMCKLRRAKPIPPKMGNLPYFRLASNQPAFTFVGLDFFGPLEVTVGRRHEKRWGALFCCQVTRGIHLEVCHGLSTDEVMMALSRFVDARGRPRLIASDNGTNFVGAAKELRENFKSVDFAYIASLGKFHEIKWTFIPPAAPHMGGSWERLVQSVKKCLFVTLREKYPKDTTLLTAFKSAENLINSRPITHVSTDASDLEPLTPNHFLRGCSDVGPELPAQSCSSDEYLRIQWKRAQLMTEEFWRRWTREYLPKLIKREKWHDPVEPLQAGDLVYLVDDQLPRNCWVKGYISKVFPGKDGQTRVVKVVRRDPSSNAIKEYTRPVTKVCPLGLRMKIQDPQGS